MRTNVCDLAYSILLGVDQRVAHFAHKGAKHGTNAADNVYAMENVLRTIRAALPVLETCEPTDMIEVENDHHGGWICRKLTDNEQTISTV